MVKQVDLSGLKCKSWTVLPHRKVVSKNTVWLCECECGLQKFIRQAELLKGWPSRCPECWTPTAISGKNHGHWKGCGDISGHRWSEIRRCGERRNIPFEIIIQEAWTLFLAQNRCCVLTGIKLSFDERTASLDRIDSSKGYTMDNIQWVHKIINQMKWSLTDQELLSWCQAVVAHATVSV